MVIPDLTGSLFSAGSLSCKNSTRQNLYSKNICAYCKHKFLNSIILTCYFSTNNIFQAVLLDLNTFHSIKVLLLTAYYIFFIITDGSFFEHLEHWLPMLPMVTTGDHLQQTRIKLTDRTVLQLSIRVLQ